MFGLLVFLVCVRCFVGLCVVLCLWVFGFVFLDVYGCENGVGCLFFFFTIKKIRVLLKLYFFSDEKVERE